MKKFILIIREDITQERSMDELYEIINLHKKWAMDLSRRGFFIDGYGIDEEGVMLSRENGTIMVDEILHPEVAFGGFLYYSSRKHRTCYGNSKRMPYI